MTSTKHEPDLLGIYLNDHLAGATAGMELARRAAKAAKAGDTAGPLRTFAAEVTEDRRALLDMMAALGVPVRSYKVWSAWIGEKAGRFKLNGRLLTRSPLSDLLELEILRLAVEGKAAGWRTLRTLAGPGRKLDAGRLDELISRAHRQAEMLEDLRIRRASRIFGGESAAGRQAAGPGR
jgi:hypothetical protein